ncbi:UNVERIFIED_CONTAM: zinc finger protein [Trichonephila clavipes]
MDVKGSVYMYKSATKLFCSLLSELFVCEICNKVFSRRYDVTKHQLFHTTENRYICEICKKAFSGKSDLKKHARFHTNEKPYVCDICKRAFCQSTGLRQHLRIHTKEKNRMFVESARRAYPKILT